MRSILAVTGTGESSWNSHYGCKEYTMPCPWCGGRNRFHVYPDLNFVPHVGYLGYFDCMDSKQGRAGCGRCGDVIDFIKQRHNCSFGEACDELGIDAQAIINYRHCQQGKPPVAPSSRTAHTQAQAEQSETWQSTAYALAKLTYHHLYSEIGRDALKYVHSRGLTDETIRTVRLGYYPHYKKVDARKWGEKSGMLRLPRGIVIPWFDELGRVVCIRFRRLPGDEGPEAREYYGVMEDGALGRYKVLYGSSSQFLYRDELLTPDCDAALFEGEIDALLASQGCGGACVCLATGSTSWGRSAHNIRRLAACRQMLVCFDNDDNQTGEKAAKFWLNELGNAKRWRPLFGDASNMQQEGLDIGAWLMLGFEQKAVPLADDLSSRREDQGATLVATSPAPEPEYCEDCGAKRSAPDREFFFVAVSEQEVHLSCSQCRDDQGQPIEPKQSPRHLTKGEIIKWFATMFTDGCSVDTWLVAEAGVPCLLALDLETTGVDPRGDRVVAITLGKPGSVTILDMRPYYALPRDEQEEWRQALALLFGSAHITWVGHNLKFDGVFLAVHFGVRLRRVYDTMLAEQVVRGLPLGGHAPATSVALLHTAARYGLSVSKEERSWYAGLDSRPEEWSAPFPPEQLDYMRQDIEVPYQLYERQQPLIEHHGLEQVVCLENGALPAIAAMEMHGVLIERESWRQAIAQIAEKHAELEEELQAVLTPAWRALRQEQAQTARLAHTQYIQAMAEEEQRSQAFLTEGMAVWKREHPRPAKPPAVDSPLNLGSPAQLLAALRALGIQADSTAADALEPHREDHPVIGKLLQWKDLRKLVTTYGDAFLKHVGPDGRIHASFGQIGAETGRMTCSKPNLQQIPKDEALRRCIIAPQGAHLLTADLSNIELRILADVSGDDTMLQCFAAGKDLHAETAKFLFHLPPETDTKKHWYKDGVSVRDVAKTINFGLIYGMGAQGLAQRIGVDLQIAEELMATYFRTYPSVAQWLRSTADTALRQGYSATVAGRKRFYALQGGGSQELAALKRQAKNHPIQGTNADILKGALVRLSSALPPGAHLILVVHDEIVVECPDERLDEVAQLLAESMVAACRDYLHTVAIPAPEVVSATYWKKD